MKGITTGRFRAIAFSFIAVSVICFNEIDVLAPLLSLRQLDLKQKKGSHLRNIDQIQSEYITYLVNQPNVPRCAQGLVIPLVQQNSPAKGTHKKCGDDISACECYGFLLRDDTVLTSVDCAKVAGAAVDISTRKTKVAISSDTVTFLLGSKNRWNTRQSHLELGVVKLKLPNYPRNSGWPRVRMFLNKESSNGTPDESLFHLNGTVFSVHCTGRAPILSAFALKAGDIIPGTFVNRSMSNNDISRALWKGTDQLDTVAKMSNKKGERWWVQKETKEVLENGIIERCNEYRGPNGTLSVVDAAGVGAVLQAEDPTGRGRRIACMEAYYHHWLKETPFSGEPFFDWLDFGSGKQVDLHACSRNKLARSALIKLFNETERENTAVDIAVRDNGSVVAMSFAVSQTQVPIGKFEYVWGLDQKFYVARRNHLISHATFFRAKPVLMAGEMTVGSDGQLLSINQFSGHYKPRGKYMQNLYQFFKSRGVNYEAVEWKRNRRKAIKREALEGRIDDEEEWIDDDDAPNEIRDEATEADVDM